MKDKMFLEEERASYVKLAQDGQYEPRQVALKVTAEQVGLLDVD